MREQCYTEEYVIKYVLHAILSLTQQTTTVYKWAWSKCACQRKQSTREHLSIMESPQQFKGVQQLA